MLFLVANTQRSNQQDKENTLYQTNIFSSQKRKTRINNISTGYLDLHARTFQQNEDKSV